MGELTIRPVTSQRWVDLVALFDEGGEPRRCWCTYFRMPKPRWNAMQVDERRGAFEEIVASGAEPGLLAYDDEGPVGWVSVAPREEFLPHLERTRVLKPAPGEGVWSVLCFVVSKRARGRGVAHALLAAAVEHARGRGAEAVEGHPLDESRRELIAMEAYVGVTSMFEGAGFTEIDRRGVRPLYRLTIDA
ncbi:GNAT family N-acetyltransferase [Pseudonocardia humida]|uniref:GNAT family N-acetyltransferase n=1 Tax=Pseudonocardia humida TaxID=2800819 RepID=A0ABT0ZYZ2_9PSEU|nr:GNAT family N-acetyltransferase [Pseudonocardia humida]MCO1655958.1 GNAT family N-acetyltransferase [Pseudonocardia humida]